jgi:large subunit ribosomal protein L24
MHVKKGDRVLVISGNDKGKQGLIREAFPERQRVIVEGINLRWRHKKPSQQNPKGERVQNESSIHVSNVMHVDAKSGKGARQRAEGAGQSATATQTKKSAAKAESADAATKTKPAKASKK